jgi:hypothetical protein
MEWQPIETAPDDGTEFLAFLPNERRKIQVSWQIGNGDMVIGGCFSFDTTKPTHWMPLPESP